MKFFIWGALSLLSIACLAQERPNKSKQEKELLTFTIEWSEGIITLQDGGKLEGLVRYDDKNGVLSYQNGETSRAFTQNSVTGFYFFDESQQRRRTFVTMHYRPKDSHIEKPIFFELIKEYPDFVILSRREMLDIDKKTYYVEHSTMEEGEVVTQPQLKTHTEVSQTTTIYLMEKDGTINPYVKQIKGTKRTKFWADDSDKIHHLKAKDLLVDYIGKEHFKKLRDYCYNNDLSPKYSQDFEKILAYYDGLRK